MTAISTTQATRLALLMTGDELMHGDIIDSNSAWLGQQLSSTGLTISEKVTVADNMPMLIQQLQRLSQQYDVLIINGGLGPTQDDLSCDAIGSAFATAVELHDKAYQHLQHWCEQRQFTLNEANKKQAYLPVGASIFANAPGSACAFYLQHNNCLIIATPGVPHELKTIYREQLLPLLQQHCQLDNRPARQRFQLFGIGESSLQQLLNEQFSDLNQHYDIGFRAAMPLLELKLQAKSHTSDSQWLAPFLQTIDEFIVAKGNINQAQALMHLLRKQKKTLGFAESCTGGLLSSLMTENSGASEVFLGSIISYSNAVKQQLLQVDKDILVQQGAVSEACAKAMLQGSLKVLQCDYSAAVTGIAGPSGGSDEKPNGTVFIAWGSLKQQQCIQLCIPFERKTFQQLVAAIALDLLRRQLLGLALPKYLSRYPAARKT